MRAGAPVDGLKADDFELREDGRIQKIELFAQGAVGEGLPLSSSARLQQQMSLTAIYDRIRAELGARYTLGYVSPNRAVDGRFRKLQIAVTTPAVKNVTVRARAGYYAR